MSEVQRITYADIKRQMDLALEDIQTWHKLKLLSRGYKMSEHPSEEVRQALIRLNDALCTWERATNRQSVLVLREDGGFIHRSLSGKPYRDDVFPTDEELFKQVSP